MTADRELLELAAKAAGIDVWWNAKDERMYRHPKNPSGVITGVEWNPLTDHGDRYRLARDLKMRIVFEGGFVVCKLQNCEWPVIKRFTPGNDEEEGLAIVGAAAEIGKERK